MTGLELMMSTIINSVLKYQYRITNESQLQEIILAPLEETGYAVVPECRLDSKSRIDFLLKYTKFDYMPSPQIGVEIKVKGATTQIIRQIHRYTESKYIQGLILLTTKTTHLAIPGSLKNNIVTLTMNSKPVRIVKI